MSICLYHRISLTTELNRHTEIHLDIREGGDIWVFITLVPKVFLQDCITTTLGTLVNFDWLVILVECPNILTNKCNLRGSNFMYHHWGCASIYHSLSYPFGSLKISTIKFKLTFYYFLSKKTTIFEAFYL